MTKILAIKATISGSFIDGAKDIASYDNIVGFIPKLDADKAQQMIIRRYAKIWVTNAKNEDGTTKYGRIQRIREVYVDSLEVVEVDESQFSYIGKNILELNAEELQDLAAAKDLAGIPLYKTGSLTIQRRIAYAEYADKLLGVQVDDPRDAQKPAAQRRKVPINWRHEGFNPTKLKEIIVDGSIERSQIHVMSLDESLEYENAMLDKTFTKYSGKDEAPAPASGGTSHRPARQPDAGSGPAAGPAATTGFTGPNGKPTDMELKIEAVKRGVPFTYNMKYETLFDKVFPDGNAVPMAS